MDKFPKSRIKNRWNGSNRFEAECFICKNMVTIQKGSSGLKLLSHDPDTGEKVKQGKGCVGIHFSILAEIPEIFITM